MIQINTKKQVGDANIAVVTGDKVRCLPKNNSVHNISSSSGLLNICTSQVTEQGKGK